MSNRLELISPRLSLELERANPEVRRKALLAACNFSLTNQDFDEPEIHFAMQVLNAGSKPSPEVISQLETFCDHIERQYEETVTREQNARCSAALELFYKARAVSALIYALSGEDSEAIYESLSARDSSQDLLRTLSSILGLQEGLIRDEGIHAP